MELFQRRHLLFLVTFLICWASCRGSDNDSGTTNQGSNTNTTKAAITARNTGKGHTTSGNTNVNDSGTKNHDSNTKTTKAAITDGNAIKGHTTSGNTNDNQSGTKNHDSNTNTTKSAITDGNAIKGHTTSGNTNDNQSGTKNQGNNTNTTKAEITDGNTTKGHTASGTTTQSHTTTRTFEPNRNTASPVGGTKSSPTTQGSTNPKASAASIAATTKPATPSSSSITTSSSAAATTPGTSTETTTLLRTTEPKSNSQQSATHTAPSPISSSQSTAPTTKPSTNPVTTTTPATTTTLIKASDTTVASLPDTSPASQSTSKSHITSSTAVLNVTTGHTVATAGNGTSSTPTSTAEATTTDIDNCLGVTCQNNGSCADLGNNYTCHCTLGWTGRHCDEVLDYCKPQPCQPHGSCARNISQEPLYYVCTCNSGWTGVNCSEDVTECANETICAHGLCSEMMGSYNCWCNDGWTGKHCDADINECGKSQSPCESKPNSNCNNTEGGYKCICEKGFVEVHDECQKLVLWPDYKELPKFTPEKNASYSYSTDIPIPYFQDVSQTISAQDNGYVTFGTEMFSLINAPTPAAWPFSPNRFGVYWADIEFIKNNQSFMYILKDTSVLENVTSESSLITYVKEAVKDGFQPLYAFVITWENAVPRPAKDYPNDTATFQLIIATDGDISYAITSYQTVWADTDVSNRPFVSTVYSSESGTRSELKPPSNTTGPDAVNLWTKKSGINYFKCVEKTQLVNAQLGAHLRSLPPCPCYEAQVSRDKRFQPVKSSSTCYQRIPSEKVGSADLSQQCCYKYGLLINNSREAGVPIYTDGSLESAFNECCVLASRLCDWFYKQIQLPNCTEYVPPFVGAGFGDPHIVTFDNNKFSFNDVGDFVIFQSGNGEVEMQGRTSLSPNGKTALFVAIAVKTEKGTNHVYLRNNTWYVNDKEHTTDSVDFDSTNYTFTVSVRNGVLSYMITAYNRDPNSVGLMGSFDGNATNDFKFRNKTVIAGTADHQNEGIINEFAESWRVSEQNSLINMSAPTPFIGKYNQSLIPSLPTSADDVIKLLSGTEKEEAQKLCGDHLFCLQDFYINRKITLAHAVLGEENSISLLTDFSSQVPKFANTEYSYTINTSSPLTLKLEIVDGEAINFTYSDDFINYTGFKLNKDTFTWDINATLEELRQKSYPRNVVFYATLNGVSSSYAPVINLCLCNQTSQCGNSFFTNDGKRRSDLYLNNDGSQKGNVNNVICECGDRATGKYCEKEVDVCENCCNTNRSECDPSKKNYCPPCPEGFDGDGIICRDKNECADNNGGCQHDCHNEPGNFSCSCRRGYLKDGKKCTDVDECKEDWNYCHNSLKYCSNLPGSAACRCYPGLVGDNKCIRAPYTFVGKVKLALYRDQVFDYEHTVKDSKEFKQLAEKVNNAITKALINSSVDSESDFYIETLLFEIANDEAGKYLSSEFAIYTLNSSVTSDDINAALSDFAERGCKTVCSYGDLKLYTGVPEVNSDGITPCNYPVINHCDQSTTTCKYEDQKTSCECKKGYAPTVVSFYSCLDIDECEENKAICGSEKDACQNTVGSYKCKCKNGQFWNETSLQCVEDQCSKNPCENDGICHVSNNDHDFVCSCTYGWNGPLCADEDTDARRMKIAVICVSAILGFCCLALFMIALVLCIKQRRAVGSAVKSGNFYSEIKPLPRQKDSQRSVTEMEENGQDNLYNRLSTERSSSKQTTFQSPTFEAKKEGNTTVYQNSAFEEEIVARL